MSCLAKMDLTCPHIQGGSAERAGNPNNLCDARQFKDRAWGDCNTEDSKIYRRTIWKRSPSSWSKEFGKEFQGGDHLEKPPAQCGGGIWYQSPGHSTSTNPSLAPDFIWTWNFSLPVKVFNWNLPPLRCLKCWKQARIVICLNGDWTLKSFYWSGGKDQIKRSYLAETEYNQFFLAAKESLQPAIRSLDRQSQGRF